MTLILVEVHYGSQYANNLVLFAYGCFFFYPKSEPD